MNEREVVRSVAAALAREPRVQLTHRPLRIGFDHGDLVLDGEVQDVVAKKLALERAAAVPGVERIVDRLHVAPADVVPDRVLLARVCGALEAEPELRGVEILPRRLELSEAGRLGADRPCIAVNVERGVVTLDGAVPSLRQKRLAGTRAWWTAGARDVVNGLSVEPPEPDSDEKLAEAVRAALEKDPTVRSGEVRVESRGATVRLEGVVGSAEERAEAERDAWCVFGVDRVDNQLRVSGR